MAVFFPIGDSPNPVNFRPWVTYALITANIAIYLIISLPMSLTPADPLDPQAFAYLRQLKDLLPDGVSPEQVLASLTNYDLFVFAYGFKPGAPELVDLLASMFLHGSFMHLASNMLFLWIYGDNVEHRIGRANYLGVYLGTGVVATLTFAMFASTSLTPLVGASGAISGVLGMYFLFFPRNDVQVFIFPLFFIMASSWVRARWVLGFYVVIDNILPFVIGSSSNVAYGAHLGGFFAGLGIAWVIESGDRGRSALPSAPSGSRSEEVIELDLAGIEAALVRGDISAAVQYARHFDAPRLAQLSAENTYNLTQGLAASGYDGLAGRTLKRALRRSVQNDRSQAVLHLALGELRLAQQQPAAAYQHLLTVLDLA
nr:rhomboid family intramembrane serine protease [Myxococcales bacterium]